MTNIYMQAMLRSKQSLNESIIMISLTFSTFIEIFRFL